MNCLLKKVEAVTAFGTIYEHLEVVEEAAPRGIHVMVEKPLAVNLEHARRMEELAKKHNIHLLTNYETTWYPSTQKAKALVQEDAIGSVRKVMVQTGIGPKKIGVNQEFFDWLTILYKMAAAPKLISGAMAQIYLPGLWMASVPIALLLLHNNCKPRITPR